MLKDWQVVGRNVACVRKCPLWSRLLLSRWVNFPQVRNVYTIRGVVVIGDVVGFHLEEIVNEERPWRDGVGEPLFSASLFRPLPITSIECFESILVPNYGGRLLCETISKDLGS